MTNDFLKIQKAIHVTDENEWIRRGEIGALRLFHRTAKTVPAYKKFLKRNGVRPASIRTIADFKHLPLVTKENYLRASPLNELLPNGNLSCASMISSSSGSTGMPFFWPRGKENIKEAVLIHELFLVEFFEIDKKRTLFVNTFAMGMWVAGTTTYESVGQIAAKYRMTIVTPGIELEQVVSVVNSLGRFYDQVIISGYPPFLKDVIDAGSERGIRWKNFSIRFLFAAESFSEKWRRHLHKMAGISADVFGSLNIYGTADALIVAHETPLSIFIRNEVTRNKRLHQKFFGNDLRMPTFAQYNPTMRYLEELPDSKLIFSSASGIPLVRYDIGDTGNVFQYDDMQKIFAEENVELLKKKVGRQKIQRGWNLPFVTIYGRDRMTASFYGLKIYPEHVRGALEGDAENRYTTGRFVMNVKSNNSKNQYLEIHIELRHGVQAKKWITRHIEKMIFQNVQTMNSEYKRLVAAIGDRALPSVILHPYSSALFSRTGKQRWKI